MVELSPACHSVCHRGTKIQNVRHCRRNLLCSVKTRSQKHDWHLLFPWRSNISSLFPCLYCVILTSSSLSTSLLSLSLSSFLFLSPAFLFSPDIKPWLLCKCIQHSNIIHCSKLQDASCFSSLHHFVAVGPFPLYVLLVLIGILPILLV